MPLPSRPLPDLAAALCFLFILLVPLAAAGLAMINTGLGRSRNAAHMMLTSMCLFAVAQLHFLLWALHSKDIPAVLRTRSWSTENRGT